MLALNLSLPAGGPTVVGYLVFVLVKLVGYSLAALFYRRRWGESRWPTWMLGPARTLVGVVAGWLVVLAIASLARESLALFLVVLLPVRVGEWWAVLRAFFPTFRGRRAWVDVTLGIALSYVLDAVAIAAAFAVPGGFWVC